MNVKHIKDSSRKLHLPITLDSEILIEIENVHLRINSKVIGIEHGKYIMAKISKRDLVGNFRQDSLRASHVAIMYLYKDVVYHFHTKILNVISEPERLIFFEYPREIEERGFYNKTRHGCFVPAQTMLGNNIVDMAILNFSNDGCLCAIDTPTERSKRLYRQLQVNMKMDIIVKFPVTNERLKLPGIVRNISKDEDRIKLGIMFDGVDTSVKEKVSDFVSIVQSVQVMAKA